MTAPLRTALVHAGVRVAMATGPRLQTSEQVEAHVGRTTAKPVDPAPPTGRSMRGVQVTRELHEGLDVYRIQPMQDTVNPAVVIYLHGGAYILEISALQWAMIAQAVRVTGATALVPIYKTAPHAVAEQTVSQCASILAETIAQYGTEHVVVMGDSAGGGLALAAALELRERGKEQPARLILISPWLDVTMTHPDQPAIESQDLILSIDGLAASGRLYAGSLDERDRRLSPLFGDMTGLGPITVFTGTYDILVVDARRLRDRLHAAGVEVHYIEEPKMSHAFFGLPFLPESVRARALVYELLKTFGSPAS